MNMTDKTALASPTDLSQLLACPTHHQLLRRVSEQLVCPVCGVVGRAVGKIVSFLPVADEFYEGKYNNRTKFLPRNDGVVATLPLRIVLQGYPTRVAKELLAGSTVVELGCAGGLSWYGKRYRMLGIDLSLTALRLAERDYACPIQADATRLPVASESVDGVISSCFFEHFDDRGKTAVLSECFRILKPGGKVIFFYDIWTENHVVSFFRKRDPWRYQREFLDGDAHIGYADIAHNEALFQQCGFRIASESYHERTPLLANSSWQKFAQWNGLAGSAARIMRALTGGALRLPALTLIAVVDATIGRLFPPTCARCVTTVAYKL